MRPLILPLILIGLAVDFAAAYEIRSVPGSHTTNIYVGDHDERIEFFQYFRVHVSSEGGIEKVLFHPVTHKVGRRSEGYRIEEMAIDENAFLQNDFVQVAIIPKDPGTAGTMEDLRASIDSGLSRQGAPHAIDVEPAHAYFFPRGSFEVRIGTPARLSRLYMESKDRRFEVTSRIPDPSDSFDNERGMIRDSLGEYLKRQEAPASRVPPEDAKTQHSRWLAFWIPLQLVLLMGLLAARTSGRPGAAGGFTALMLFPNAAAAIGWFASKIAPLCISEVSNAFIPLALPNIVGGALCVFMMGRLTGRDLPPQGLGGIALYLAILTLSSLQMNGAIGSGGQIVLPIVAFKWAAILAYPMAVLWTYFSRPRLARGSQ